MNIFRKLRIFKDTAVTAHEKFNQNFWCDTFQDLKKCIEESENEKKVDSAYKFLAKHWPKMQAAGIDIDDLANTLHPLDEIKQSEALQSAGAFLSTDYLFYRLFKLDGLKLEPETLSKLHALEADINKIVSHSVRIRDIDNIKNLKALGVDDQIILEKSKDLISDAISCPRKLYYSLRTLKSSLASDEEIQEYLGDILANHFTPNGMRDARKVLNDITFNDDYWEKIGIQAKNFIGLWVKMNYMFYLQMNESSLFLLPSTVSVRDFFHHVELREIDCEISYQDYTFDQFIRKSFLPAGGDIEQLAQKASWEKLDYENPVEWLIIAAIYVNGGKLINRNKLLTYVDPTKYSGDNLEFVIKHFKTPPKDITEKEKVIT